MSSHQHGETIPFETKALREDEGAWGVSGYASTFGGKPDRSGDIVMPGAFTKSLKAGLPQFLYNHAKPNGPDNGLPIGVVVDCHENKRGLFFRAEMPMDDQFVQGRVVGQLRHRGLKGVSIGYKIIEQERRHDARYLKQVQLFEISLTPIPANPDAQVTEFGSKSFDPGRLDVVERALEEATREMQSLARRVRGR
jgi:uncharacterized protein